MLLLDVFAVVL